MDPRIPISLDIETSGLDPEKSFITCIGFASNAGIHQSAITQRTPEKVILEQFTNNSKILADGAFFVTYNGRAFDYPFIIERSKDESIKSIPQVDLEPFARAMNGGIRISKDQWMTKYLNIYIPKLGSGAWLSQIYSAGNVSDDEHMEMLSHNALDLANTLRAFHACKRFPNFSSFVEAQLKDPTIFQKIQDHKNEKKDE